MLGVCALNLKIMRYRIVSETIYLHAFSLPKFILPTFQKARLKYVKSFFGKSKWKILLFSYYENEECKGELKRTIIRVC